MVSSIRDTFSYKREERCDYEIDSIHEPSTCSFKEKCDASMEDVTNIDSKDVVDGSVVKYKAMDSRFSQREGVSFNATLT